MPTSWQVLTTRGVLLPSLVRVRRERLAYRTHGPRDARRIAFTIDDGPGALTEQLLEVLGHHGAKATFNVLGERLRGREELLCRTLDEGHELGNHAYHHENLAARPFAALGQILRTNAGLRSATGFTPRLFRAPYGAVSRGVILAAGFLGMTTVGWDVDPRDYETPGAETIHERVVTNVRPGSIVLLHDDRRALDQTATALEEVLRTLRRREFEFVTASELLGQPPIHR